MNIKIKPTEKKVVNQFPKLMFTDEGYVVYFTDESCGICLQKPPHCVDIIGGYSEIWVMDGFKDFNGEVILSNK